MTDDLAISPKKREQLRQLFVRGNEQMSKGNYEYADDIYFTQCVLEDPGNPIYAATFLANLRKKFGGKRKAISSFIAAGKRVIIDTENPGKLFQASVEALKSNPWDTESLIFAGKACQSLGFLKTALIYHQSAVDTNPNHIGANIACCATHREATDYDAAIACVRRIMRQRPDDREVQQLLHNITVEKTIHKGKYASGGRRDTLESSSTAIPQNEDVMGRTLTVGEQLERKIAKDPQNTTNYIELAHWYYRQSLHERAEECYARAVNVSNNDPKMVELLLEAQEKRLRVVTLRLREEYEMYPQEELKSVFFASRSQYIAKCMELAQHRVKHNPTHTGHRYNYGVVLRKDRQAKEAIAEFQIAKADSERAGDCLLELGRCFQMLKQYELAMIHYHEAVQTLVSGENKKKALYYAMKLAFALEQYTQAKEYGHQLAAIDFAYRDLGEALEQIAQCQANG